MKTVLKKIQIISLVALVGFGAISIINGVSFQHTTNTQYVLSKYFPKWNSIHSRESQQSQSAITTTSFPNNTEGSNNWSGQQSQSTVTTTSSPNNTEESNNWENRQPQNNITTTSLPNNTEGSSNWSGYIATPTSNSGYTSISGSWTVPNISESQRNAVAAQWIGLGGVNSTDLLQMGTMEQIENGQPMAEVFWEQLPDVSQNVMSVPIGSIINVSISNSSSSSSIWNLTFTVRTPGGKTQTQTIPVTLDSSYAQGIGTSAEWISEDPSNQNSQLIPLANMGIVKYQSALVNGQPLNALGNNVQPVAMVSSNGTVMISPSELGTDGESFTTTTSTTATTNTNSTLGYGLNGFTRHIQRRNESRFHWNR
ncbi:G1 family glutamic endopeptidase [Clostridium pasteurianum]|uniref:Peptidase A4 family n=1 Tax=Clostridium pasteurianum BC1 TaxID=86416 RepID=R4K821_CLOPA|nr:G1 family glutamic endopeptidase [Clostridium pasteurianum]AGK95790.1 Peptidase A4 family [Clostridium pasteurianum BC1]